MDQKTWDILSALLDKALEQPEESREGLVLSCTAGDESLRQAALGMLSRMKDSADFLEVDGVHEIAALAALRHSGQRFGAWRIDNLIGQGGMGSVYAVSRQDSGFEQSGALKHLPDASDDMRWRFEAERQILARLDHPGIAKVLDGGVDETGRPWMVIERIDGGPVDVWCREQSADFATRVRLTIETIEAVAFAHKSLVLHRDLKPSNVLIDTSGRVRVIDFGIAKQMESSPQTEGILPLSAPYAAPELLTGDPVGPPCDVYGAGALLYELLTGKPPIDLTGVPVAIGIGRILDTQPAVLHPEKSALLVTAGARQLNDVNAVLQKALRKPPGDRYATLEAMAEDLRRVLIGSGVEARADEGGYKLRRQLWSWRWPIVATVAIVVSLSAGMAATLWQRHEALAARDAALAEEARGDAVRQSLYLLLGESAESGGADTTGRDVLLRATNRIQRQYISDPADAAPLLHALGELYFYLGDYDAAITVLRPLVQSGETSGVDPETLAAARYDLAQSLIRAGASAEAAGLLRQAQAFWASDPQWRSRLIDSRLVEAQTLRPTDAASAARLLESALADHIALHGSTNRQAGVFQNNLGVTLQSMSDLDGARQALQAAREVWRVTGLTETPDALNTANNLAAIETLQGRPDVAAPLFEEALTLRKQQFGASAATAALMNNYGKVLLQLGRANEARPILADAVEMAERYAGAGSVLHVAALSGLSEAEVEDGDGGEATAARAVQLAGEHPVARTMANIALARALGNAGEIDEARRVLQKAEADIAALGPSGTRLQQGADSIRSRYRL